MMPTKITGSNHGTTPIHDNKLKNTNAKTNTSKGRTVQQPNVEKSLLKSNRNSNSAVSKIISERKISANPAEPLLVTQPKTLKSLLTNLAKTDLNSLSPQQNFQLVDLFMKSYSFLVSKDATTMNSVRHHLNSLPGNLTKTLENYSFLTTEEKQSFINSLDEQAISLIETSVLKQQDAPQALKDVCMNTKKSKSILYKAFSFEDRIPNTRNDALNPHQTEKSSTPEPTEKRPSTPEPTKKRPSTPEPTEERPSTPEPEILNLNSEPDFSINDTNDTIEETVNAKVTLENEAVISANEFSTELEASFTDLDTFEITKEQDSSVNASELDHLNTQEDLNELEDLEINENVDIDLTRSTYNPDYKIRETAEKELTLEALDLDNTIDSAWSGDDDFELEENSTQTTPDLTQQPSYLADLSTEQQDSLAKLDGQKIADFRDTMRLVAQLCNDKKDRQLVFATLQNVILNKYLEMDKNLEEGTPLQEVKPSDISKEVDTAIDNGNVTKKEGANLKTDSIETLKQAQNQLKIEIPTSDTTKETELTPASKDYTLAKKLPDDEKEIVEKTDPEFSKKTDKNVKSFWKRALILFTFDINVYVIVIEAVLGRKICAKFRGIEEDNKKVDTEKKDVTSTKEVKEKTETEEADDCFLDIKAEDVYQEVDRQIALGKLRKENAERAKKDIMQVLDAVKKDIRAE